LTGTTEAIAKDAASVLANRPVVNFFMMISSMIFLGLRPFAEPNG
jgi:hypothetical protein